MVDLNKDLLKSIRGNKKVLNQLDVKDLVTLLEQFNKSYREGRPEITDKEYDLIHTSIKALHPNEIFFNKVESEPLEAFSSKKIQHSSPMLSIDKAYSFEEVQKYLERVKKHENNLTSISCTFRASPKLDGMAGNYENDKLVTRGDGESGFDISKILAEGVIAVGGDNTGSGEIVLEQKFFDKFLSTKFSHPRNVIVGIAGSDKINDDARKALESGAVLFVPHSSLESWSGNCDQLLSNFSKVISKAKISPYPTDGVVLEVIEERIKKSMGSTNHHHNWQIAYKEKGETAISTVNSISWQLGRTGRCTPVLNIEEAEISGAKIRRVTAHHAGMIKKLNLGKGAIIEIIRSGEVIPKIVDVIKASKKTEIISSCPSCGKILEWNNDFLVCNNRYNCKDQQLSKLVHFFNILGNVDLLGSKTLEKFFEAGFTTLESIYSVKLENMITLGLGPKQSSNIMDQILRSKTEEIDDWRFLAAFGIPHLGKAESKRLLSKVPLEKINELSSKEIETIEGFGPIASPSIYKEIQHIWPTISLLINIGFSLRSTESKKIEVDSSVFNLNIIFTGKMDLSRPEMHKRAMELGANVQSSVNKKTDILVIGENVGQVKIEKANKFGVKVLTEKEYYELIK